MRISRALSGEATFRPSSWIMCTARSTISALLLSSRPGPYGKKPGVPLEGMGFAASVDPEAVYNITDTFDLYDGGVLDMTFLGAAEIDAEGNVNVSKFGARCTGPGGFINSSQNTPKVYLRPPC